MGNFIDCCRKPYTVQYNSEIALCHCDTNVYDHDGQSSPGKNFTGILDVNNQTVRRNSLFSPKVKNFNNLGTELNENSPTRYKDEFMKNFTLMLHSTYGSNYDSLFYENEFEMNFSTVQNFIEKNKDSIPILCMFIYNTNDSDILNSNLDDEETLKNQHIVKKVLGVNPYGMFGNIKSIRGKNDGVTIFGIQKSKEEVIEINNPSVDYLLDLNYKEYEDILNSDKNSSMINPDFIPLFAIKFDMNSLRYYIKDLYSGIPTVYKVKNETVLKNNSLITIGESYILATLGEMSNSSHLQISQLGNHNIHSIKDKNDLINIKVFNKNGQLIHDPINFQPSKSSIRLGRSKDNEIVINDSTISRTHCTIQYDEVVGWTIRDGHFQKKNRKNEYQASTNSSWVYIGESTVVVDGLLVRCGSLSIQFSLELN